MVKRTHSSKYVDEPCDEAQDLDLEKRFCQNKMAKQDSENKAEG